MHARVSFSAVPVWLVCAGYMALLWFYTYPPLTDFPQHVAQVALLRDMLLNQTPWAESQHLRLNFFTPYLIGYLPAALLSFFVAPLVACKLVLSLAFLAFLALGQRFLRHFNAPAACIWLLPLGFHGFAWQAGFYTFVVTAPLLFPYLVLAHKFALQPSRRYALLLAVTSPLLLFCHLLVGLLGLLLAGLFILTVHYRHMAVVLRAALAFAPAAAVLLAYALYSFDDAIQATTTAPVWQPAPLGIFNLLLTATDGYLNGWRVHTRWALVLALALLLIPTTQRWFGIRWQTFKTTQTLPVLALLAIAVAVPVNLLSIEVISYRYSIFLLPFLAILLTDTQEKTRTHLLLAALCLLQLAVIAGDYKANAQYSADFTVATQPLPAGQRILNLSHAPWGADGAGGRSYINHPLYYQADHGGWVDFNFSVFRPQIVRQTQKPAITQHLQTISLAPTPQKPDWMGLESWRYSYLIIWSRFSLPPDYFSGSPCTVLPVGHAGNWQLFKNRNCAH